MDNNPNKLGVKNYGIKTISPWKLKKLVKEKIDMVLVASNRIMSYSLDELINQLDELEINNYKVIPTRFFRKTELNEKDLQELKTIIFSTPYKVITQLQHLQFHVMDNCNLNCKRCQHFSNLAEKDIPADFDEVTKDFERLRELFDDINVIAMLGGEPLLNQDLDKYCDMIRRLFPYSIIEIITNGLLVRHMPEKLISALCKNNIRINISYYPVLSEKIDDIVSFLRDSGIQFMIGNRISSFSKKMVLNNTGADTDRNFRMCRDRCCTTLREGKLYPCYLPATIKYFNKKFGYSIGDETVKDAIDLYDRNVSGTEIIKRLRRGFDICRYCGREEWYDWEQNKMPQPGDWLL